MPRSGYPSVRVVIRAFNKEGYHRDILIASERQVHQGLLGWGGQINPEMFPEMTYFEVVIQTNEV